MDSSNESKVRRCVMLRAQLMKLRNEQAQKDTLLSELTHTRNMLLQTLPPSEVPPVAGKELLHYPYIFPLLSDIYMLELKIKEQQKKYEEKNLQVESARLGQAVLAASLEENDCVLKGWERQLTELANKDGNRTQETDAQAEMSRITNIIYQTSLETECLKEDLGFTVLCQGVHVRVRIQSKMTFSSIHLLSATSANIGVNSDTFVPGLVEKVKSAIADGSHISEIVLLVSKYIQEDMAPYVIVIPMKKKGKKSKGTKSLQKLSSSGDPDTGNKVSSDYTDTIHGTDCTSNKTSRQADIKDS